MKMKTFVVAIMALAVPATANAEELCKTRFLRTVSSVGGDAPHRAGSMAVDVTQYVRDARGNTSFCAHGGYCYPEYTKVKGKRVLAQVLVNCRIDWRRPDTGGEPGKTYYSVE